MTNFVTSLIRTWVPIGVGAIVSWLLTKGVVLDADAVAGAIIAVTAVIMGIYYAVVRWLETKYPAMGWLLGQPKAPGYSPAAAPPARPAPGRNQDI